MKLEDLFDKMNEINKLIKKCNKTIEKLNKINLNNIIIHLEPPYNNICQYNCNKNAGYIKNGFYCCWFHIT